MALSRVKVWGAERLYASDLNAEFNNIINNAASLISPLSAGLDWDGYAHTLDSAGVTTAQSTSAVAWTFTPGSKQGTPSTTGGIANWAASTWTDSATAGSGTVTSWVGHAFQRPTLAASNSSVTTTDAASVYIANSPLAGSNETLTNAWSFWVDAGNVRLDGDAHVQADLVATINKYSLSASVAASALTIALKDRDGNDPSASVPITFKFRSATATTPTYTIGTVSAATSLVISSGSTLGTTSGVANRLHVGALLTGSTVELLVWNPVTTTGLVGFRDNEVITTTSEGGAGGADTAGLPYSTTARSGVAWVYLGYVESTQATAGTWATSPSKVQTAYDGMPRTGDIIQVRTTVDGAYASGTTVMVNDNTIPQSGEGDQYLSQAITPTSAINRLRIFVNVNAAASANSRAIMALFQDSTADALATCVATTGAGVLSNLSLLHWMLAGTASATTFKIRIGVITAGTLYFNGEGSALFNGTLASRIEVAEVFA